MAQRIKKYPVHVTIDFDTVYAGFWLNAHREEWGLKELACTLSSGRSSSWVFECQMTKEIHDQIRKKRTMHITPIYTAEMNNGGSPIHFIEKHLEKFINSTQYTTVKDPYGEIIKQPK